MKSNPRIGIAQPASQFIDASGLQTLNLSQAFQLPLFNIRRRRQLISDDNFVHGRCCELSIQGAWVRALVWTRRLLIQGLNFEHSAASRRLVRLPYQPQAFQCEQRLHGRDLGQF